MRGPTLPFALTKTYGPNSVDLREKFFSLYPYLFSLFFSLTFSAENASLPFCFVFFFSFHLTFFLTMCPSLIRVRFYPETIYLLLVQFILHELSSIHFMTSEIFVKISSLELLATYHSETRKKIPIVSEFNEISLSH